MSQEGERQAVTRDVEPAALRDLMEKAPYASVAFTDGEVVALLPARAHFRPDTWLFGVVAGEGPDLEGREVVVAIDDGPFWFELRGVSVRGTARRSDPPPSPAETSLTWYVIDPRRILAWDYDQMRRL